MNASQRIPRSSVPQAAGIPFMLAERCVEPFDDPAWLFELKYDGFRVLAAVEGGRPHLYYRGGSEATACFPEVADALARLRDADAVLKIAADRTGAFVIVGLTRVAAGEEGSLHLAVADGSGLEYAGSVGSGFKAGTLAEARRILGPYELDAPPCAGSLPSPRSVMWVRPLLVCEVRYKAWTAEGRLRLPVFKRFRPEARTEDCRRERRARSRPPARGLS